MLFLAIKDLTVPGTLITLITICLVTFTMFDLILYPAIFKSRIIIGYGIVEINMPGLVSFKKRVLKDNIARAYIM